MVIGSGLLGVAHQQSCLDLLALFVVVGETCYSIRIAHFRFSRRITINSIAAFIE
jgi:hypothetical protein